MLHSAGGEAAEEKALAEAGDQGRMSRRMTESVGQATERFGVRRVVRQCAARAVLARRFCEARDDASRPACWIDVYDASREGEVGERGTRRRGADAGWSVVDVHIDVKITELAEAYGAEEWHP